MKNRDEKAANVQKRRRLLVYLLLACVPVWAVVAAINGSKDGGGAIGAFLAAAITVSGLVVILACGVGGAAVWRRLSESGTEARNGYDMRFNPGDIVSAPNGIVDRKLIGPDDVLVPRGTRGRIVTAYPIGAGAGIRSVYPVYDVNWNNGRALRVEQHLLAPA